MTIEQLKKANEIYKELNVLQDFMDEQNKHCLSEWRLNFGDIEFDLRHVTGIKAVICDFTSDKITELEKQLEEL